MRIKNISELFDQKEAPIQKEILEYLELRPGKYWRQNTGAVVSEYKNKKRFIRFGVKGQADITGILNGRRIEIETKNRKGTLSLDQELFRDMIESQGGIYVVARCVQDVIRAGF